MACLQAVLVRGWLELPEKIAITSLACKQGSLDGAMVTYILVPGVRLTKTSEPFYVPSLRKHHALIYNKMDTYGGGLDMESEVLRGLSG